MTKPKPKPKNTRKPKHKGGVIPKQSIPTHAAGDMDGYYSARCTQPTTTDTTTTNEPVPIQPEIAPLPKRILYKPLGVT